MLGGVVAFLAGSLLLFDTDVEGFRVSIEIIVAFGLGTVALVFFVGRRAYQHWKRGPVSGVDAVIGETATVVEEFEKSGRVRVAGEIWSAVSDRPLEKDDTVIVKSMDGLTLTVEKVA